MGYIGKYEEKLLAQKLRRQGYSYSQIRKKISVSKSTMSLWCRDVALTPEQALKLFKKKLEGAERGRIIGAKKQQQARIARTKKLLSSGKKEVGKLTKKERFIAGIGLYAGDGSKGDKNVNFANSNPKIISFMVSWLREFFNVREEKFRGAIWIHDNLDVKKAEKYWSKLTKIPLSQFNKTYIAENKEQSRKIRKQIHKYGVFAIRISRVELQRKMRGWMAGVLECYNRRVL